MTTLRIEVGRHCSTTIPDVVEGLRRAGCMKYLEMDPDQQCFLDFEELRQALEADGYHVEVRREPPPPPLPLWRRVRAWPMRMYLWARRVVLRETEVDQWLRVLYPPGRADAIDRMGTRESPVMRKFRGDDE
jgi:hypothetical protein